MYPAFQRSIWDEWAQAIASPRGGEAQLATLAGAVRDWDTWLAELSAQGLALAVWRAVRDTGIQQILPESVATSLEGLLREAVEKLGAFEGVIPAFAGPLKRARIEWVLVEAPAACDAAGNAQQRPSFRILVRPEALPGTVSSLSDEGWECSDAGNMASRARDMQQLTHGRHPECSLIVQSGLLPGIRLSEEESVWTALEERPVEGCSVSVPGRGAALFHSILRAFTEHRLEPPGVLLDVVQHAGRLDRAEWEVFLSLVRCTRTEEECWIALRAAVLRQGLAVPESALECLLRHRPGVIRRRAALRALSADPAATALHRMMLMPSNEQRDCYAESLLLSRSSGTPGAASLVRAAGSLLFSASVP